MSSNKKNIKDLINYYTSKNQSSNFQHRKNPIDNLSIEDIVYLQKVLEQHKQKKIKEMRNREPPKMQSEEDYYNLHEYGPRDKPLPSLFRPVYRNGYEYDPKMMQEMGITSPSTPSHIRDIDIESSLRQSDMQRLPGQRNIHCQEQDRFNYLPFDPQDPNHIVWSDGMPRGGYSTRTERLDVN